MTLEKERQFRPKGASNRSAKDPVLPPVKHKKRSLKVAAKGTMTKPKNRRRSEQHTQNRRGKHRTDSTNSGSDNGRNTCAVAPLIAGFQYLACCVSPACCVLQFAFSCHRVPYFRSQSPRNLRSVYIVILYNFRKHPSCLVNP